MAGYSRLIAEIESIADMVQAKDRTAAKWLDVVTNEIEASEKKRRSAAETPSVPDWEASDEAGHQDSYDAKNYHKFPVGKDSLSKLLDRPSAADSDPDFADEGKIQIQASSRKAAWPFSDLTPEGLKQMAESGNWRDVARAAKIASVVLAEGDDVPDPEGDLGDPTDTYSTAGLPETGGDTPIDDAEEGEDLQFFGTVGAGELHMPSANTGPKRSLTPEAMLDQGRDPVTARKILEAAAGRTSAEVSVKSPESMGMESEVERDQALGGRGKGKSDTGPDPLNTVTPITGSRKKLSIRVPALVSAEDRYLWETAARHIARQGEIKVAGNRVNYPAINAEYSRLKASRDRAREIFHGGKR